MTLSVSRLQAESKEGTGSDFVFTNGSITSGGPTDENLFVNTSYDDDDSDATTEEVLSNTVQIE